MFPLSSLNDDPHRLSFRNFWFLSTISDTGDICSSSLNDLNVDEVDKVDIVDPVVVVDVIDALVDEEEIGELDPDDVVGDDFRQAFVNKRFVNNITDDR